MGTVRDQHSLIVQDAVVDDSRVVRDHDSTADRAVIDVRAGLLLDPVGDGVVHGGRTVRGTDHQRVAFEEDLLALQLLLSETEPGVIITLERDGRIASRSFFCRHGLDSDELSAVQLEDTGSLVAFGPAGPGIRLRTCAALLRLDSRGNAKVHWLALGVVVAVVDVVLGGVRDVLERHLICGSPLVHTDYAGSCQLVRAADVVVRGVRFSFGRGCRNDTETVFRDSTDVIKPCRLPGVSV